jgi:hypothetical protein
VDNWLSFPIYFTNIVSIRMIKLYLFYRYLKGIRVRKLKTKPNVYSKSNPELLLKFPERAIISSVFLPSGMRWKSNWKY